MLRMAVLGAGRIGQVHAKAIASVDGAQLQAVFDPFEDAASALSQTFGCDIREVDEIAKSDDVDAVVICTPTDLHADQIELFARAGKAVFCEKPVDLSLQRVKECLKVVEDTGTTLMVGFNRRYDPDFRSLHQAIADGRIGDVEQVAITSRDPSAPPYEYITRSGGIFRDMCIHDFDIARWLLGEEAETIQASASVLTDPKIGELGDYDTVSIILRTASGKQATISGSRRAVYGYDQRIEVHGSKGAVNVDNHHLNRVTVADANGYARPPLEDFFMTRYIPAYAAEIAHFVASVSSGQIPQTSGRDGLIALAMADAANLSVETGKAIKLAEVLNG